MKTIKNEEMLQAVVAEIRGLKRAEPETYFTRYFEEVFPFIRLRAEGYFRDMYRNASPKPWEKYGGLIQTVGDSPEPLVLAIVLLRPKEVLLIHSPETKPQVVRISQQVYRFLKEAPPLLIPKEVESSQALEVYRAVKEQWQNWQKLGIRTAVDITGGKKSMVSGASQAAAILNLDVFYMDHYRYDSEARRPVSGSEYLHQLPNPMEVLGEVEYGKAVELFRSLNFGEAAQIFQRLHEAVPGETGDEYHAYHLLSEAYKHWDAFDIGQAYGSMKDLIALLHKLSGYSHDYPLAGCHSLLHTQFEALQILNRVMKETVKSKFISLALLEDLEKLMPLMMSICLNALRRRDQQKYDMAALLMYRVLEMMAQRRLAVHGIVTEAPQYPAEGREDLEQRFSNRLREIVAQASKKSIENIPVKPLPEKITVFEGYVLLDLFGDTLVKQPILSKSISGSRVAIRASLRTVSNRSRRKSSGLFPISCWICCCNSAGLRSWKTARFCSSATSVFTRFFSFALSTSSTVGIYVSDNFGR